MDRALRGLQLLLLARCFLVGGSLRLATSDLVSIVHSVPEGSLAGFFGVHF